MQLFLGLLTIAIGAFMSLCGIMKSNFVVYRLLVVRSKIIWGDKVHFFYGIAGAIVVVVGILLALGVFKRAG